MDGVNELDGRFQTFWIQIRKNKPLDESRKTGQTSGTKMTFYSYLKYEIIPHVFGSQRFFLQKSLKTFIQRN
ncbi:hypothetical protein Hanom_Chr02g00163551 [Helianthus anomalus]